MALTLRSRPVMVVIGAALLVCFVLTPVTLAFKALLVGAVALYAVPKLARFWGFRR